MGNLMATLGMAIAVLAQNIEGPRVWSDGLYATEGDVTTCPYRIIGRIEAPVHTNTIFGGKPRPDKVIREIRERAEKLGADAIVNVEISPEHATMVWGRVVTGTGDAVKFVDKACAPK
jgi:hypothetical protein